jgi:hypothetical protein
LRFGKTDLLLILERTQHSKFPEAPVKSARRQRKGHRLMFLYICNKGLEFCIF